MVILEDILNIVEREVKEESENITQIALTFFSAYTGNPQNTRILAPSGEGKTYLVLKVANHFPSDDVIILSKATPQSIKYNLNSKRVIENGDGNFQDYDVAIKPLEDEISKTKDKEKQQELKNQIRELQNSAYDYIDFEYKTIVLVDSQSAELFETLKTTLSHDKEFQKSFSVNKSKSGTISGQKFVFHGWPALIYCSAKDEQKHDQTNEMNTRFHTISLRTTGKKYRKMLEHQAVVSSIPNSFYQEEILSGFEIGELNLKVESMINDLKGNSEIFNPFGIGLSGLFEDDAGYRTRQLKILDNNICVHTLVNRKNRPKIIYKDEIIPISTWFDIETACNLTKNPREIQPYKIKQFNKKIRPAILEHGKELSLVDGNTKGLTASEILAHIDKKSENGRQKLQETILKPLVDQGFLEETEDPNDKRKYIYYLPKKYLNNDAIIESTLIDISLLDDSCVDSFVRKYLKQRFEKGELTIEDEKENSIDPRQLIELVKNRHSITQNRHELDNSDSSIDNEVKK